MKEIIKQFFSVNLKDYSNLCVDFEINKALVVLLVVLCISSSIFTSRERICTI